MVRVQSDPVFRSELISEATSAFLDGDIETGKRLLQDYLNATEVFPRISKLLQKDDKSLRRMVGRKGNPTEKNFIEILHACQQEENIRFEVRMAQK